MTPDHQLQSELQAWQQAARQARHSYNWAKAAALYSQALEYHAELTAETAYQLYHGRAACYHELARYNAARRDLDIMQQLADQLHNERYHIDILLRLSSIGELTGAPETVELAQEAWRKAQTLKDQKLEAVCLLTLGRAAAHYGYETQSISWLRQAIGLARQVPDLHIEAESLFRLGESLAYTGRTAEGQPLITQALTIARQLEDLPLEAEIIAAIAITTQDLAQQLRYLQRALHLQQALNRPHGQAQLHNHLINAYTALGLHGRARYHAEQALYISQTNNSKLILVASLVSAGKSAIALKLWGEAAHLLAEAAGIVQELHLTHTAAVINIYQGQMALEKREFENAQAYLQNALQRLQPIPLPAEQATALALLGAVHLQQRQYDAAVQTTAQAVQILETADLHSRTISQQEIWWWRYQALYQLNPAAEATFAALDRACETMLQPIESLSDEALRRGYLNKIPINRQIVFAWARACHQRHLSLAQLTDRQLPEHSLPARFQRLVDTGTRLTNQRNPETLVQFIIDEFVELSGVERAVLLIENQEQQLQPAVGGSFTIPDLALATALRLAENLQETMRINRTTLLRQDAGLPPIDDVAELHQWSLIMVPLVSQDRFLGTLYGDMRQIFGRLSEADLNLLTLFANQAAAALANAHWIQHLEQRVNHRTAELKSANRQLEQHNTELTTVNAISKAIASELELSALINLIGEKMRHTFNADIVYVALHDTDRNMVHFPYQYGDIILSRPFGSGLTEEILLSGEPLLINEDLPEQSAAMNVLASGKQALSYLGVPIFVERQAIGVISVQSTEQEGRFTQDDLRLLTTIAAHVGTALHNAQLFEASERQAQEMAALAEVGREILASLDLSVVLKRMTKLARELLAADHSAIYLPDQTGQFFQAIVAEGDAAAEIMADVIQLGEGIIGDLAYQGEAAAVNDPYGDPRVLDIPGTEYTSDEKLMVAPLLSGEQVNGMMAVWRAGRPFTTDDLNFLRGLTRLGAIALENARLFKEAKEARTVAESARLEAEQASRAKSAFLANMTHELRTPLNAIIGFTRIVRRRGEEALPEKQLENLDKVLTSADHLLNLINTVLDISKIEAGRMEISKTTFDPGSLAQSCITTVQPLLRPGVEIKSDIPPDLPPMYSDYGKIQQILINLLANAAKFTHEGHVRIRVQAGPEQIVFGVEDTGIGISKEALGRIFDEFQQADSSATRRYGGTGLGLSISRSLAKLLGGKVSATSIPSRGSIFLLVLPIGQPPE